MAEPSRVGTSTIDVSSSNRSSVSFSHTTTADTDLLLVSFGVRGNESISVTPQFNSSDLTLVHDTGDTGSATDIRIYVYGVVAPGAVTANVTATYASSVNPDFVICRNWTDVVTTSVAAATNFISEDINTVGTSTSVLTSGGSSGNTLHAGGAAIGAKMRPVGWSSAAFNEITEGQTGTGGTTDFAFADAEYTTLPAGTTITWNDPDENTAVLIELVAAGAGPAGNPPAYTHHLKQMANN